MTTAGISPIGPKYYGSKTIYGTEKTLGEYNAIRGWNIPENENPERPGYMVQYEDGYISWSPKEVFESAYRKTDALTFGQAIEAAKAGKLIARTGWNGKGMFVFQRPADEIPAQLVIENVKSIPNSVKLFLHSKYKNDYVGVSGEVFKVKFTAYLCMYTADGSIVNGWLASQTDMLAEDWMILD